MNLRGKHFPTVLHMLACLRVFFGCKCISKRLWREAFEVSLFLLRHYPFFAFLLYRGTVYIACQCRVLYGVLGLLIGKRDVLFGIYCCINSSLDPWGCNHSSDIPGILWLDHVLQRVQKRFCQIPLVFFVLAGVTLMHFH